MKFVLKWEKKIVPEWRHKYLDFYFLMKMLGNIEKQNNESLTRDSQKADLHKFVDFETSDSDDGIRTPLTMNEILFIEQLHDQLIKVDDFYQAKEQETTRNERKILSILCHIDEHAMIQMKK